MSQLPKKPAHPDQNFQSFIDNEVIRYKRGCSSFLKMMHKDYYFEKKPTLPSDKITHTYKTDLDDICDNVYMFDGAIHYTSKNQEKSIRVGTIRNYFYRTNKKHLEQKIPDQTVLNNKKVEVQKQNEINIEESAERVAKAIQDNNKCASCIESLQLKKKKIIDYFINEMQGKYYYDKEQESINFDLFAIACIVSLNCYITLPNDEVAISLETLNNMLKRKTYRFYNRMHDCYVTEFNPQDIKIVSAELHFKSIDQKSVHSIIEELHDLEIYLDLKNHLINFTLKARNNTKIGYLTSQILQEFEKIIKEKINEIKL